MPVIGAVAKIPRRSVTARSSRRKSWPPTMNGLPCVGSAASSAFAAKLWSPGLKKVATLPKLRKTLVKAEKGDVLELDEMWSYVFARKNKRWVWLAQCRRTRQIVAYALGDRSEATSALLWNRVPKDYKGATLYSDFWEAYQKVLPDAQHEATGKGAGQTCHITIMKPRASQQYYPPASRAVCEEDALVFQV